MDYESNKSGTNAKYQSDNKDILFEFFLYRKKRKNYGTSTSDRICRQPNNVDNNVERRR